MRTEVKLAIVVVLIAVIGVMSYFLSRGREKPIELTPAKPPIHATGPKAQEPPLPIGPGGLVTERPDEAAPPTGPTPSSVQSPPRSSEKPKPVYTIDLSPLDNASTTRPRGGPGRSGADSSDEDLIPNQPAKIDIASESGGPKSSDQAGGESATSRIHIVKPGETLIQIARNYYGKGDQWRVISKANRNLDPKALKVGMKLTIPGVGKSAEKPTAGERAKELDPTRFTAYTVEADDTFYSIARDQLGDGARWKEILELNKDRVNNDPKNLRAGQTIYLPVK